MTFVHKLAIWFLSISVCYSYSKVYLDDVCVNHEHSVEQNVNIKVTGSGISSGGILRPEQVDYYKSNKNCVVTIEPPDGYGIVASIKTINFLITDCTDSLTIYTEDGEKMFCSFGYYPDERYSLWTPGPMRLKYQTGNRLFDWGAAGFVLTFTAFKNDTKCGPKEFLCRNDRCIWSGFKCDNNNNCGDLSDETYDDYGGCSFTTDILGFILSVVSFIIVALILSTGIAFCLHMKKRVVTTTTIIEGQPTYGSVPKTTYSPPIGPTYQIQQPPYNPPVQQPQGGFANPMFSEAPPPPYRP